MSWKFFVKYSILEDARPGDLCWLDDYVTIFDEENRRSPRRDNMHLVIQLDESFIVLEPKNKQSFGNMVRIYHRLGTGYVSKLANVRILIGSEYFGKHD